MLPFLIVVAILVAAFVAFLRWDVSENRDYCLDCRFGVEHSEHPKEDE